LKNVDAINIFAFVNLFKAIAIIREQTNTPGITEKRVFHADLGLAMALKIKSGLMV
jgi:hypothetical protein